jgi:hypothetical protein
VVRQREQWRHLAGEDGLLLLDWDVVHQPHHGLVAMSVAMHGFEVAVLAHQLVDPRPLRPVAVEVAVEQAAVVG